jgi:hypothetical protein
MATFRSRTGSTISENVRDPMAASARNGVKTKYDLGETTVVAYVFFESLRRMYS